MQKEKIQEFTRRVSQDNRTSLIVTMYDIMLTYLDEAKAALEAEDREGFKAGLRHADRVLVQLQDSLNFKYSPADTLYALYVYCREELALAMAKQDLTRWTCTDGSLRTSRRLRRSCGKGHIRTAYAQHRAGIRGHYLWKK